MVTRICSVLIAVALGASLAHAQTPVDRRAPPLPTAQEQRVADIASWVTVGAALTADTIHSWRSPDRTHALEMEAVRLGVTEASVLALKTLFHRARPCAPACGADNPIASMPSGHTAFAFSTIGGPSLFIPLPLSLSTGGLRIAANKHYLTDVLGGAGVGLLMSRIR